MLTKLVELGLLCPTIASHVENFEPVKIDLGKAEPVAVYKIQPGLGVLVWMRPMAIDRSRAGKLIFLRSDNTVADYFQTVGHLHGWKAPECEIYSHPLQERMEDRIKEARQWNKLREEWHEEHFRPAATAVSEACMRLGVTTLIKHGGDFCKEVPGVTLLDKYLYPDARQFMTEYQGGHHFVIKAKE